jgi:hypothetical protein
VKAGTMPGHDRHSEIVPGRPHFGHFVPIAPSARIMMLWWTLISCSAVRVAQQPFREARVPFLRAKAVSKPDTFFPLMPASLKVPLRESRESEELRW